MRDLKWLVSGTGEAKVIGAGGTYLDRQTIRVEEDAKQDTGQGASDS